MLLLFLLDVVDRHLRVVGRGEWGHLGVGSLLELRAAQDVPRCLLLVHLLVAFTLIGAGEPATASVAGKRLLAGVGPDVGGEVVRAGETAETDVTLKRFLARVDPEVSRELV